MKSVVASRDGAVRRAVDVRASFRYAPLVSHIDSCASYDFYELYLSKKLDRSNR